MMDTEEYDRQRFNLYREKERQESARAAIVFLVLFVVTTAVMAYVGLHFLVKFW